MIDEIKGALGIVSPSRAMFGSVQNNCPLGELTGTLEKAYIVVKEIPVREVENKWGIGLEIGEVEENV